MEFKVVVSDPTTGKSYQLDIKDDKAVKLKGKNIGEEVDGAFLGLSGYKLKVSGGSDKSGVPMKKGIHGSGRLRVLLEGGVGYNPKRDERQRKLVRGEKIDQDIIQVNLVVATSGKKKLEEILGSKEGGEAATEGEVAPAPAEKPEEKPKAEEPAASEKEEVKDEPKEEKPKDEPKEKPKEESKEKVGESEPASPAESQDKGKNKDSREA